MTAALSWRQIAAAASSGLLLTLSFPRPQLALAAWFALVPLLLAIATASRRGAFLLGWIAGATFFTGSLRWLVYTMVHYGHLPEWLGYPLLLLLAAYLAVYVGLFALTALILANQRTWIRLVALPAAWTAVELTRTYLFTGLPWGALGYSQAGTLPVIQIAEFTGVYGVSYLIVFVNTALAVALAAMRPTGEMPMPIPVASFVPMQGPPVSLRGVAGPLGLAVLALLAVLVYGHWRLDQIAGAMAETTPVTVAVVQGNIDQDRKWDPAFRRETIDRYQALTREQADQPLDLIVWPEAAMPFFFERDVAHREELIEFVVREGTPLLFGSPAVESAVGEQPRLYNSAYVVTANGGIAGRYDKLHLVPFGEYVPLERLLFFVNKMVDGIGEFVPGENATVFRLDRFRLGVMICFEVVFPELTRAAVRNGATLMAAITNDAWFGRSAAPYQHLDMVVFRAVENRVPFARAANTGISGFIDATGRLVTTSDLFVPATRVATLVPRMEKTWYTRYGDLFAWFCAVFVLAVLARAAREARREACRGKPS
ncbi:MAG: apolipoprotein N-acyltransferase [Nitrospirota bacterium]